MSKLDIALKQIVDKATFLMRRDPGDYGWLSDSDIAFNDLVSQALFQFVRLLKEGKSPSEARLQTENDLRAWVIKENSRFKKKSNERRRSDDHGQDILWGAYYAIRDASK